MQGVCSLSVDTHKFGLAHKGSSVVLYADPSLRAHQVQIFATAARYCCTIACYCRAHSAATMCTLLLRYVARYCYCDVAGAQAGKAKQG